MTCRVRTGTLLIVACCALAFSSLYFASPPFVHAGNEECVPADKQHRYEKDKPTGENTDDKGTSDTNDDEKYENVEGKKCTVRVDCSGSGEVEGKCVGPNDCKADLTCEGKEPSLAPGTNVDTSRNAPSSNEPPSQPGNPNPLHPQKGEPQLNTGNTHGSAGLEPAAFDASAKPSDETQTRGSLLDQVAGWFQSISGSAQGNPSQGNPSDQGLQGDVGVQVLAPVDVSSAPGNSSAPLEGSPGAEAGGYYSGNTFYSSDLDTQGAEAQPSAWDDFLSAAGGTIQSIGEAVSAAVSAAGEMVGQIAQYVGDSIIGSPQAAELAPGEGAPQGEAAPPTSGPIQLEEVIVGQTPDVIAVEEGPGSGELGSPQTAQNTLPSGGTGEGSSPATGETSGTGSTPAGGEPGNGGTEGTPQGGEGQGNNASQPGSSEQKGAVEQVRENIAKGNIVQAGFGSVIAKAASAAYEWLTGSPPPSSQTLPLAPDFSQLTGPETSPTDVTPVPLNNPDRLSFDQTDEFSQLPTDRPQGAINNDLATQINAKPVQDARADLESKTGALIEANKNTNQAQAGADLQAQYAQRAKADLDAAAKAAGATLKGNTYQVPTTATPEQRAALTEAIQGYNDANANLKDANNELKDAATTGEAAYKEYKTAADTYNALPSTAKLADLYRQMNESDQAKLDEAQLRYEQTQAQMQAYPNDTLSREDRAIRASLQNDIKSAQDNIDQRNQTLATTLQNPNADAIASKLMQPNPNNDPVINSEKNALLTELKQLSQADPNTTAASTLQGRIQELTGITPMSQDTRDALAASRGEFTGNPMNPLNSLQWGVNRFSQALHNAPNGADGLFYQNYVSPNPGEVIASSIIDPAANATFLPTGAQQIEQLGQTFDQNATQWTKDALQTLINADMFSGGALSGRALGVLFGDASGVAKSATGAVDSSAALSSDARLNALFGTSPEAVAAREAVATEVSGDARLNQLFGTGPEAQAARQSVNGEVSADAKLRELFGPSAQSGISDSELAARLKGEKPSAGAASESENAPLSPKGGGEPGDLFTSDPETAARLEQTRLAQEARETGETPENFNAQVGANEREYAAAEARGASQEELQNITDRLAAIYEKADPAIVNKAAEQAAASEPKLTSGGAAAVKEETLEQKLAPFSESPLNPAFDWTGVTSDQKLAIFLSGEGKGSAGLKPPLSGAAAPPTNSLPSTAPSSLPSTPSNPWSMSSLFAGTFISPAAAATGYMGGGETENEQGPAPLTEVSAPSPAEASPPQEVAATAPTGPASTNPPGTNASPPAPSTAPTPFGTNASPPTTQPTQSPSQSPTTAPAPSTNPTAPTAPSVAPQTQPSPSPSPTQSPTPTAPSVSPPGSQPSPSPTAPQSAPGRSPTVAPSVRPSVPSPTSPKASPPSTTPTSPPSSPSPRVSPFAAPAPTSPVPRFFTTQDMWRQIYGAAIAQMMQFAQDNCGDAALWYLCGVSSRGGGATPGGQSVGTVIRNGAERKPPGKTVQYVKTPDGKVVRATPENSPTGTKPTADEIVASASKELIDLDPALDSSGEAKALRETIAQALPQTALPATQKFPALVQYSEAKRRLEQLQRTAPVVAAGTTIVADSLAEFRSAVLGTGQTFKGVVYGEINADANTNYYSFDPANNQFTQLRSPANIEPAQQGTHVDSEGFLARNAAQNDAKRDIDLAMRDYYGTQSPPEITLAAIEGWASPFGDALSFANFAAFQDFVSEVANNPARLLSLPPLIEFHPLAQAVRDAFAQGVAYVQGQAERIAENLGISAPAASTETSVPGAPGQPEAALAQALAPPITAVNANDAPQGPSQSSSNGSAQNPTAPAIPLSAPAPLVPPASAPLSASQASPQGYGPAASAPVSPGARMQPTVRSTGGLNSASSLARQRIARIFAGVNELNDRLSVAVSDDPAISLDKLIAIIEDVAKKYPELSADEINTAKAAARAYDSNRAAVAQFLAKYKDSRDAFRALYNASPSGDVEISAGPGVLVIRAGRDVLAKATRDADALQTLGSNAEAFYTSSPKFNSDAYNGPAIFIFGEGTPYQISEATKHEIAHAFFDLAHGERTAAAAIEVVNRYAQLSNAKASGASDADIRALAQRYIDAEYAVRGERQVLNEMQAYLTGRMKIVSDDSTFVVDISDGLKQYYVPGYVATFASDFAQGTADIVAEEENAEGKTTTIEIGKPAGILKGIFSQEEMIDDILLPKFDATIADAGAAVTKLMNKGYTRQEIGTMLAPLPSARDWRLAAAFANRKLPVATASTLIASENPPAPVPQPAAPAVIRASIAKAIMSTVLGLVAQPFTGTSAQADLSLVKSISSSISVVVPNTAVPLPLPRPRLFSQNVISGARYGIIEQDALIDALNLSEVPLRDAAALLPYRPASFPVALPPQDDSIAAKRISEMTDMEMVSLIRKYSDALQNYWAAVFKAHGTEYRYAEVVITDGEKVLYIGSGPGLQMLHNTGEIQVDLQDFRNENQGVYKNAAGAVIAESIAHELGHYVADLTGITDKVPGYKIDDISRTTGYGLDAFKELQADYLAGLSMRGSGLLRQGDPEQMYYDVAGTGDDIGAGIPNFVNSAAPHGTGRDRAAVFYDGLMNADLDKGMNMLGVAPDWGYKNKAIAWNLYANGPIKLADTPLASPLPNPAPFTTASIPQFVEGGEYISTQDYIYESFEALEYSLSGNSGNGPYPLPGAPYDAYVIIRSESRRPTLGGTWRATASPGGNTPEPGSSPTSSALPGENPLQSAAEFGSNLPLSSAGGTALSDELRAQINVGNPVVPETLKSVAIRINGTSYTGATFEEAADKYAAERGIEYSQVVDRLVSAPTAADHITIESESYETSAGRTIGVDEAYNIQSQTFAPPRQAGTRFLAKVKATPDDPGTIVSIFPESGAIIGFGAYTGPSGNGGVSFAKVVLPAHLQTDPEGMYIAKVYGKDVLGIPKYLNDFQMTLAKYQALRNAGLPTLPTLLVDEKQGVIVETNLNTNQRIALAANNENRLFEEKSIKEIPNVYSLSSAMIQTAEQAAKNGIGIPYDAWFILAPRPDSTGSFGIAPFADVDNVEIGLTPNYKLLADNLKEVLIFWDSFFRRWGSPQLSSTLSELEQRIDAQIPPTEYNGTMISSNGAVGFERWWENVQADGVLMGTYNTFFGPLPPSVVASNDAGETNGGANATEKVSVGIEGKNGLGSGTEGANEGGLAGGNLGGSGIQGGSTVLGGAPQGTLAGSPPIGGLQTQTSGPGRQNQPSPQGVRGETAGGRAGIDRGTETIGAQPGGLGAGEGVAQAPGANRAQPTQSAVPFNSVAKTVLGSIAALIAPQAAQPVVDALLTNAPGLARDLLSNLSNLGNGAQAAPQASASTQTQAVAYNGTPYTKLTDPAQVRKADKEVVQPALIQNLVDMGHTFDPNFKFGDTPVPGQIVIVPEPVNTKVSPFFNPDATGNISPADSMISHATFLNYQNGGKVEIKNRKQEVIQEIAYDAGAASQVNFGLKARLTPLGVEAYFNAAIYIDQYDCNAAGKCTVYIRDGLPRTNHTGSSKRLKQSPILNKNSHGVEVMAASENEVNDKGASTLADVAVAYSLVIGKPVLVDAHGFVNDKGVSLDDIKKGNVANVEGRKGLLAAQKALAVAFAKSGTPPVAQSAQAERQTAPIPQAAQNPSPTYAFGDSYCSGMGLKGTCTSGIAAKKILENVRAFIKNNPGTLKGQTVLVTTGAPNAWNGSVTSQGDMEAIRANVPLILEALKTAVGSEGKVIAVGPVNFAPFAKYMDPKLNPKNTQGLNLDQDLKRMADDAGVQYASLWNAPTAPDGYHPKSPDVTLAAVRAAPPANTAVAQNNPPEAQKPASAAQLLPGQTVTRMFENGPSPSTPVSLALSKNFDPSKPVRIFVGMNGDENPAQPQLAYPNQVAAWVDQVNASGENAVIVVPKLGYPAGSGAGKWRNPGTIAKAFDEIAQYVSNQTGVSTDDLKAAPQTVAWYSGGYEAAGDWINDLGKQVDRVVILDGGYGVDPSRGALARAVAWKKASPDGILVSMYTPSTMNANLNTLLAGIRKALPQSNVHTSAPKADDIIAPGDVWIYQLPAGTQHMTLLTGDQKRVTQTIAAINPNAAATALANAQVPGQTGRAQGPFSYAGTMSAALSSTALSPFTPAPDLLRAKALAAQEFARAQQEAAKLAAGFEILTPEQAAAKFSADRQAWLDAIKSGKNTKTLPPVVVPNLAAQASPDAITGKTVSVLPTGYGPGGGGIQGPDQGSRPNVDGVVKPLWKPQDVIAWRLSGGTQGHPYGAVAVTANSGRNGKFYYIRNFEFTDNRDGVRYMIPDYIVQAYDNFDSRMTYANKMDFALGNYAGMNTEAYIIAHQPKINGVAAVDGVRGSPEAQIIEISKETALALMGDYDPKIHVARGSAPTQVAVLNNGSAPQGQGTYSRAGVPNTQTPAALQKTAQGIEDGLAKATGGKVQFRFLSAAAPEEGNAPDSPSLGKLVSATGKPAALAKAADEVRIAQVVERAIAKWKLWDNPAASKIVVFTSRIDTPDFTLPKSNAAAADPDAGVLWINPANSDEEIEAAIHGKVAIIQQDLFPKADAFAEAVYGPEWKKSYSPDEKPAAGRPLGFPDQYAYAKPITDLMQTMSAYIAQAKYWDNPTTVARLQKTEPQLLKKLQFVKDALQKASAGAMNPKYLASLNPVNPKFSLQPALAANGKTAPLRAIGPQGPASADIATLVQVIQATPDFSAPPVNTAEDPDVANTRAVDIVDRFVAAKPESTPEEWAALLFVAGLDKTAHFTNTRAQVAGASNPNPKQIQAANIKIATRVAQWLAPIADQGIQLQSFTYNTNLTPEQRHIEDYLWSAYRRAPLKIDSGGDFTWKDITGALNAGMTLHDYVIGGMNFDIKTGLYAMGKAMDAEEIAWSFLAAYRGLERPAATGQVVASNPRNSQHYAGGYGQGNAADVAAGESFPIKLEEQDNGKTIDVNQAKRDAANKVVWDWIAKNGSKYGMRTNFIGNDPAHVQPGDEKILAKEREQIALEVNGSKVFAGNAPLPKPRPNVGSVATYGTSNAPTNVPPESLEQTTPLNFWTSLVSRPPESVIQSFGKQGGIIDADFGDGNLFPKNVPANVIVTAYSVGGAAYKVKNNETPAKQNVDRYQSAGIALKNYPGWPDELKVAFDEPGSFEKWLGLMREDMTQTILAANAAGIRRLSLHVDNVEDQTPAQFAQTLKLPQQIAYELKQSGRIASDMIVQSSVKNNVSAARSLLDSNAVRPDEISHVVLENSNFNASARLTASSIGVKYSIPVVLKEFAIDNGGKKTSETRARELAALPGIAAVSFSPKESSYDNGVLYRGTPVPAILAPGQSYATRVYVPSGEPPFAELNPVATEAVPPGPMVQPQPAPTPTQTDNPGNIATETEIKPAPGETKAETPSGVALPQPTTVEHAPVAPAEQGAAPLPAQAEDLELAEAKARANPVIPVVVTDLPPRVSFTDATRAIAEGFLRQFGEEAARVQQLLTQFNGLGGPFGAARLPASSAARRPEEIVEQSATPEEEIKAAVDAEQQALDAVRALDNAIETVSANPDTVIQQDIAGFPTNELQRLIAERERLLQLLGARTTPLLRQVSFSSLPYDMQQALITVGLAPREQIADSLIAEANADGQELSKADAEAQAAVLAPRIPPLPSNRSLVANTNPVGPSSPINSPLARQNPTINVAPANPEQVSPVAPQEPAPNAVARPDIVDDVLAVVNGVLEELRVQKAIERAMTTLTNLTGADAPSPGLQGSISVKPEDRIGASAPPVEGAEGTIETPTRGEPSASVGYTPKPGERIVQKTASPGLLARVATYINARVNALVSAINERLSPQPSEVVLRPIAETIPSSGGQIGLEQTQRAAPEKVEAEKSEPAPSSEIVAEGATKKQITLVPGAEEFSTNMPLPGAEERDAGESEGGSESAPPGKKSEWTGYQKMSATINTAGIFGVGILGKIFGSGGGGPGGPGGPNGPGGNGTPPGNTPNSTNPPGTPETPGTYAPAGVPPPGSEEEKKEKKENIPPESEPKTTPKTASPTPQKETKTAPSTTPGKEPGKESPAKTLKPGEKAPAQPQTSPGASPGRNPGSSPSGSPGGSAAGGGQGSQGGGGIGQFFSSLMQLLAKLFGPKPPSPESSPPSVAPAPTPTPTPAPVPIPISATTSTQVAATSTAATSSAPAEDTQNTSASIHSVSMYASPEQVSPGKGSNLIWTSLFTASATCEIATSDGSFKADGGPSGVVSSPLLYATTRFVVTCQDPDTGETITDSATVNVKQ
ncbi:MAG: hypothetical protein RLZZ416_3 [Candidatus Parcubacteria bacterium]|jgi:predicted metalloprotease